MLDHDTYLTLAARPTLLREQIPADAEIVVIDEIQKLPLLLNEVHLLIESRGLNFLLTGSSARKLKQVGTNLLGGRARHRRLHPLIYVEMKDYNFDLLKVLNYGSIPSIFLSQRPQEDLAAYTGDYLQHEIMQEGLIRNLPSFSRFLEVAAACNGQQVDYKSIADDA